MRTREAIHGFGQKRPRVTIDEDSINKVNDTISSELKVEDSSAFIGDQNNPLMAIILIITNEIIHLFSIFTTHPINY